MASSQVEPNEDTVLIVGVGLIGGSLAAAVRQRGVARRVIGLGRNPERLADAVRRGLLDDFYCDEAVAAREASFVVICTPVARIVSDVRALATYLPEAAVLTDAGSTKRRICADLADMATTQPTFVGSHPIAGSEKQGHEFADADLFQGRLCVITPQPGHAEAVVTRVERFWEGVGMRLRRLTPEEHDRALARTSHVPHVVAAAAAGSLDPADLPWTGTGFRDTTRIAAGDPELWTGILLENTDEVRKGIADVRARLEQFDAALASGNAAALKAQLQAAKTLRDRLETSNGS